MRTSTARGAPYARGNLAKPFLKYRMVFLFRAKPEHRTF